MSRKTLVLGVDGGGTKTVGLVADQDGTIISRREVRGTNPNVVGFETAAKTLFQLIHSSCEEVRCEPGEFKSVLFGLAGVGRASDRARIRDDVNALLEKEGEKALPITVETDARVALEGAFDGGPGVVIIAGTGSIIIGKTSRGDVLGVGGWGRTLGDEGSGFFIGREALIAVTLHYDKRGDSGRLREIFARQFKWESRDQIIAAIYQEKFDIASLAPVVIESAANNDIVSQRILQKAATLLVEQARVIVMQMGIVRKVGLVLSGGLVDHETVYRNVLHMKILRLLPQVDVRAALHPPANGAVLMALDRLKKS
ncbi:MAG: N-acetylglucosamine kinase [Bacteroidota bacterium]